MKIQSDSITASPTLSQLHQAIINLMDAANPNILKISGLNDASEIGYFVSGIGDINHDGVGDLLISTAKMNQAANSEDLTCNTEAYIVYGQSNRFKFPKNVSLINGTNGFSISNIQGFLIINRPNTWEARCKSIGGTIGDLNKDGIDDLIIANSEAKHHLSGMRTGAAYIIFGNDLGFGSTFDIMSLNGLNGFRVSANYRTTDDISYGSCGCTPKGRKKVKALRTYTTRSIGSAVSGVGDLNGDGKVDVVITDSSRSGDLYIVQGAATYASLVNAEDLGTSMFGTVPWSHIGQILNSEADINHDGFADIVINTQAGLAVLFGRSDLSAGYNMSALEGRIGFNIVGAPTSSRKALVTGDINGDGFGDIIFSSVAGQSTSTSSVYVMFGRSIFGPVFNVSSLDGTNGITIDGTDTSKKLGVSIATGNINGDRFADLIIAESDSACISGSAYVIFGRSDFSAHHPFALATLDGVSGYKIINIPGCDYLGFTVSCGDVDGNGWDDVLIGSGARMDGADAYVVFS